MTEVGAKPTAVPHQNLNNMYYHIIEDGGYGNLATRGFYKNETDALNEANRLQSFFPDIVFYVYPSHSKRQPEFVTV